MKSKNKKGNKGLSKEKMIQIMAQEVAENMDLVGLIQCAKEQDVLFWRTHSLKAVKKAFLEHQEYYDSGN